MKRLTEEMVIARAKISDLSQIKRFNCWGNELTDVSLLRQMSNVEVLSLSINKINSLVDFQFCRALQDLYVRQNNIKDLNEVCYLQNLPNLKHLWLGENPCALRDGYRLSVLRALPNLQKLDDITITPEELSEANKNGQLLCHPDDEDQQQNHGDYYNKNHTPTRRSTPEISPTRLEPTRQNLFDPDEDQDYCTEPEDSRTYHSPNGKESPPRKNDPDSKRILYSPEPDYSPTYYDERPVGNHKNHTFGGSGSPKQKYQNDRSPLSSTNTTDEQGYTPDSPKEERLPHSSSVHSVKDYVNGDGRYYQQSQNSINSRHNDGSDESNNGHYDYQSQPLPLRQSQSTREVRERITDRCERPTCTVSHRPPFHRRPVTRNSNILSAVLCLVKELDYPSLEVVEMAVRCRMDEVED